jgi:DNA-binding transcriptional LysR family regulator
MSVEWQQLEYFRVVGRLQHVTRAAEELGMTQPALSRAIARLERELGVALLHRVGRSVRLTRYGEAFLRRVERALDELAAGRRELADMTDSSAGTVALGFLRTLGVEYVPALIRRFTAAHPDVRFSFSENNGPALEQQPGRGEIDLALTRYPFENDALEGTVIARQDLMLLVPLGHRLAERRSVRLREVANEPFVAFKPGHAIRKLTDDLCAKAEFTPRITFEADESSSLRGFAAAGLGVAILPAGTGPTNGLVLLRISEPEARRDIVLAWAKERYMSASVRLFRSFVVEAAHRPAQAS